jgi:hypothetical protein
VSRKYATAGSDGADRSSASPSASVAMLAPPAIAVTLLLPCRGAQQAEGAEVVFEQDVHALMREDGAQRAGVEGGAVGADAVGRGIGRREE